jgi:hypothetical protein
VTQSTSQNNVQLEAIKALIVQGNEVTNLVNELMQQAVGSATPNKAIAEAQAIIQSMVQVGKGESVSRSSATIPPGVRPHQHFHLKVTESALGRQVSFTIPAGMSGMKILELIEKANPREDVLDGVIWPSSNLSEEDGLNIRKPEDTTYTFTICRASGNQTRLDQTTYLIRNNLMWAERWILTVGSALFRDMRGFPDDEIEIGTPKDAGDLFEGMAVRARLGALESDCGGLRDSTYGGAAYAQVIVAGVEE